MNIKGEKQSFDGRDIIIEKVNLQILEQNWIFKTYEEKIDSEMITFEYIMYFTNTIF